MHHKGRLVLIALMLIVSAAYAVLVASNPRVASAMALGYIAFLLTVFAINSFWKRHP